MYALDFEIWGSAYVDDDNRADVCSKMIEANSKLFEVRNLVNAWDDIPKGKVYDDEKRVMMEIRRALQAVGSRRYDLE
jgi:hypothetical protein